MAAFEVIALDTATPQLRAPGASDTYTFPRAVEMPLGTANGVLYLNSSKVVTSGSALTFDGTSVFAAPRVRLNDANRLDWGDQGEWIVGDNAGAMIFGVDVSEKMRLNSTGLGIGTSSPLSKLVVSNGSNKNLEVQPGATTYLLAYDRTAGDYLPLDIAAEVLVFSTNNGTERMRLDTSGNLGIGTTSPKSNAGYATLTLNNAVNGGVLQFTQADTTIGQLFFDGNGGTLRSVSNDPLVFGTNNTERARIPAAGGMVVGTAALATTATDGFLYVPTCAGTPTGTPTTQTGTAPIVVDTTNNKLYFYSGGQWRDAGP